jgi:hypothetical protein
MTTPTEGNTMNDLQRLVPEGTTHFAIEERQHRGSTVYAVVAIVPHGAAVPLNGYSTRELAESTVQNLRANPAAAYIERERQERQGLHDGEHDGSGRPISRANPTDEQLVEQAFALRDSLAEQRKKRETETSDGSANPTTPPRRQMPDLSAIAWMETSEDKDDSL